MTETGKAWASAAICTAHNKRWKDNLDPSTFRMDVTGLTTAEFWLRTVFNAIEERAGQAVERHCPFNAYGWAFGELKRELLGDDQKELA